MVIPSYGYGRLLDFCVDVILESDYVGSLLECSYGPQNDSYFVPYFVKSYLIFKHAN